MFELHIDDKSVETGSVPIRWCMDKESAEEWVRQGQAILLVVSPLEGAPGDRYRGEMRMIRKVEDLMAFVSFARPGKTRIHAFVMKGKFSVLKDRYLRRRDSRYDDGVFDYWEPDPERQCYFYGIREIMVRKDCLEPEEDAVELQEGEVACPHCQAVFVPGSEASSDDQEEEESEEETEEEEYETVAEPWVSDSIAAFASIDVDVPEGAFAKEPPSWLRAFVQLPYRTEPRNQCEFRERAMLSVLATPGYVLGIALGRLFYVLCTVIMGSRGTYYRVLTKPSQNRVNDVYDGPRDDMDLYVSHVATLFCRRDGGGSKVRKVLSIAVTPLLWMLVMAVYFPLVRHGWPSGWEWLLAPLCIAAVTVLSGIAFLGGSALFWSLFSKTGTKDARAPVVRAVKPVLTPEELEFLSCARGDAVDPKLLPARRRTVRLYIDEWKAKGICRPFSS